MITDTDVDAVVQHWPTEWRMPGDVQMEQGGNQRGSDQGNGQGNGQGNEQDDGQGDDGRNGKDNQSLSLDDDDSNNNSDDGDSEDTPTNEDVQKAREEARDKK